MKKKKKNIDGLKGIISNGDYGVAIAVVGAITALMIPLPTPIIDILLTFSITLGMVILLVSMFIKKPLEFSVFPALLLFLREKDLNLLPS